MKVVTKERLAGREAHAKRIAKINLAAASEEYATNMGAWARWFLVAVRSGREISVVNAMTGSGVRAWVTVIDEERVFTNRRRGGKRSRHLITEVVHKVAFPGYIAVWLAPSAEAWHGLLSFEQVLGLVVPDAESWASNIPEERDQGALSPREVARMHGLEIEAQKDLSTIHSWIKVGQAVRVFDGPFEGLAGFIAKYETGMAVVWVDIELFGRVTPVELWLDQIEKCA